MVYSFPFLFSLSKIPWHCLWKAKFIAECLRLPYLWVIWEAESASLPVLLIFTLIWSSASSIYYVSDYGPEDAHTCICTIIPGMESFSASLWTSASALPVRNLYKSDILTHMFSLSSHRSIPGWNYYEERWSGFSICLESNPFCHEWQSGPFSDSGKFRWFPSKVSFITMLQ